MAGTPDGSTSRLLYTCHLKDGAELQVSESAVTTLRKTEETFALDTGAIRCAVPVSFDTIRIFWRSHKDGSPEYLKRYRHDMVLDLKKMQRRKAGRKSGEESEAQKISRILLDAAQKRHGIKRDDASGPLAMHAGEQMIQTWDAECRFGKGLLFLSSLGIYFVARKKGLCMDMPLDMLDSYHAKDRTVTVYYFEPQWKDGYEAASKGRRKVEIRIKERDKAHAVCKNIEEVYGSSDAREARQFAALAERFGGMMPDQVHQEYYTRRKNDADADGRPIDRYISILAKKMWDAPTTREVADCDAAVIRACLFTGIPVDVAGELTRADKKFREETDRYNVRYRAYRKQYDVLREEMLSIVTANLTEDDAQKIRALCNPYVVCDTVAEFAQKGRIRKSFRPKSLKEWQKFKKTVNDAAIPQQPGDLRHGLGFGWEDRIFCPWKLQDAKRIAGDRDFLDIQKAVASLNEKYDPVRSYSTTALFAKKFERSQRSEISLRVRRVYDHWCKKTEKVPDPHTKCTDWPQWMQYVQDGIDESRLERHQRYSKLEKTVLEEIMDAHTESQNTETRLQRATKPKGIQDCDIYEDAWHDREKRLWFTTNPYLRISGSDQQVMGVEQCEQRFGCRATAFPDDAVKFRHGLPAIHDEVEGLWVLLCTVRDDALTAEMVSEKMSHDTLRYNVAQPALSIADDGSVVYETEREYFLDDSDGREAGKRLPFYERLRRLVFTYTAMHAVKVTDKDMQKG